MAHDLSACSFRRSYIFDSPEVSPVSKRVVYLTDEQWKKIEPLIPKPPPRPRGGRPRA
ncbi:MAG: transposase, partial [Deltaproteobacteria bacterium]|nr:transposase [Deltaproteobacteria bacterium]